MLFSLIPAAFAIALARDEDQPASDALGRPQYELDALASEPSDESGGSAVPDVPDVPKEKPICPRRFTGFWHLDGMCCTWGKVKKDLVKIRDSCYTHCADNGVCYDGCRTKTDPYTDCQSCIYLCETNCQKDYDHCNNCRCPNDPQDPKTTDLLTAGNITAKAEQGSEDRESLLAERLPSTE